MANVLGKEPFKIMYLDTTWKTINATFEVYDSKYTYNIRDDVMFDTISGDRLNVVKGNYHKFEITYHKMDKSKIQELKLMQSKQIRFYPHIDSSAYYTVNCTLVKPFYIKNLYSTDGCRLVFETDSYQDVILKDVFQTVSDCWHMNDLSGIGLNGNQFSKYGTMSNVTDGTKTWINLSSGGSNYIRIPNYEKTTEWTFHTWINIPYDADTGYFFTIGADGVANQSLALWKRGGWTTDGGLVEVFIGGVSKGNITLQADKWHLLSIKAYSNNLYLYQDGYQRYFNAKGTTSVDYFYLGAGTGDRTFQLKLDETVLFKTPCIRDNTDTLAMYNQGKGILVDLPKFYFT